MLKRVEAGVLSVACEESGAPGGRPVVLLHGFPYDAHAYDEVAPRLAAAGCHVIVPYLRGYGPTRFVDPQTPRSGQQAALGRDLLDLLDALGMERAALAGYDWGGRAACVVAALWPERVASLVSIGGYNLQNIARSGEPAPPIASTGSGTSGISTPSGVAPGSQRTAGRCAGSYGSCGRRIGISTRRPTSGRRRPSIIPILSRW